MQRKRYHFKSRKPKTVELAGYLSLCSESDAVKWLQHNRTRKMDDFRNPFSFEPPEPEWDPLLDKILYRRDSRAIDMALARYGICIQVGRRLWRKATHTIKVNLFSNPEFPIGIWSAFEGSEDEKRAVFANTGLNSRAWAKLLSIDHIDNTAPEMREVPIEPDEAARRLYYLADNPHFINAASGALQPEDNSMEYIGFPWSDTKERLASLLETLPTKPENATAIIAALSNYHAGAQNEIKCKDPIGTIDRWAKQEETDPYAYGSAGQCVANAIIFGREEWMFSEHHLAFGGFCHNVRIGSFYGIFKEDLLTEKFKARVKKWQESERNDELERPQNPFLFNQGLWSSEQGREIIRHFGAGSYRAYERLEVQFRETHPVWFAEKEPSRMDDEINQLSLEEVRKNFWG